MPAPADTLIVSVLVTVAVSHLGASHQDLTGFRPIDDDDRAVSTGLDLHRSVPGVEVAGS
jgi:hypothetical protein